MTQMQLPQFFAQPPQLTPEQTAQIEAFNQASQDAELAHRFAILRFRAIMCSCSTRYSPLRLDTPPDFAHCVVHGGLMLHPQTGQAIM